MASLTQWTWVWANSGRDWRTGKPGRLQSMGWQRVGLNWATEQQKWKNSDNTKSWWEYGQAGSLIHCCWRGKMAQPLWKKFIAISLKTKLATAIPPSNCTDGLYREMRVRFTKSVSCSVKSDSLQPMDHSPKGSSVYGILQARILEWAVIPFFRGSSRPRDWTWVSCMAGRFFTIWAMREAQVHQNPVHKCS